MGNETKRIYWEKKEKQEQGKNSKEYIIDIDEEKSISADYESNYMFKLKRKKDKDTHKEILEITCLMKVDDSENKSKTKTETNRETGTEEVTVTENGTVTTTISKIHSAINEFMDYGVVFDDLVWVELSDFILKSYKEFEVAYEADSRWDDLILAIDEYINCDKEKEDTEKEDTEKEDEKFYAVPVNDFNDLMKDCGYYTYEQREIRKRLYDSNYISVTTNGRYTTLVRKKDKVQRVIKFNVDSQDGQIHIVERDING